LWFANFLAKKMYLKNVGQTKRGNLSRKPKTLNPKRDTKRLFFMSLCFFGACHVVSISRTSSEKITGSLGLVFEGVARSFLSLILSTFFVMQSRWYSKTHLKNKHHDFLGKPVPKVSYNRLTKKPLIGTVPTMTQNFSSKKLFLKKIVYGRSTGFVDYKPRAHW